VQNSDKPGSVLRASGGFVQFRQTYPDLCSQFDEDRCTPPCVEVARLSLRSTDNDDDDGQSDDSRQHAALRDLIVSSPPTLVAPYLYIGNAQNAIDIDCLRTNGIRYIVNVTNNVPNKSVK